MIKSYLFCIGFVFLMIYRIEAQRPVMSNEIQNLIQQAKIQPNYARYKPNFHIKKTSYQFHGANGDYQNDFWEIKDGEKIVAVYLQEPQAQIDVIAPTPETAPTQLDIPSRYHYGAMFGNRFTTIAYWPEFKVSGDKHEFHFEGGGYSLIIVESQEWLPEGKYKCKAKSVHTVTLRVDPVFGYVFDINCTFESDRFIKGGIEFTNLLSAVQSNPWPDKWKFDYTVYSSADTSGYVRFSSNLAAGDLSDEIQHNWGKGTTTRNGGLMAFVDRGTYSPALLRTGNATYVQNTCNVWLDQHNKALLPEKPDADGMYRVNPRFRFVYVPPAMADYLIENSVQFKLKKDSMVQIRLGVDEGFEEQPLSTSTTVRGICKGWWEKDFVIDQAMAHSGKRSIRIDGISDEQSHQKYANFIITPQILLDPNSTYKIEAFVRLSGDAKAFISADFYEWTPHDDARLKKQQTNMVSKQGKWEKIELVFTTPNYDPFVDLRFMVVGSGFANFDDFSFKKVQP